MEGQTWICLYNLLSCREVMDKYDINDFRVGVLLKLQSRSVKLKLFKVDNLLTSGYMRTFLTSYQC